MKIYEAQFITSSASYAQAPKMGPAIFAFVGRSNVGKSSLINMLLNQRLAKTSSTPGKTQLINYFMVNSAWYFVDLPGYGWAKVGKTKRQLFSRVVQDYLLFGPPLVDIFLLLDVRHAPQKNDAELLMWLLANRMSCTIVFTKADKVSAAVVERHKAIWQSLVKSHALLPPPVFVTSSTKKLGKQALLDHIGTCIEFAEV